MKLLAKTVMVVLSVAALATCGPPPAPKGVGGGKRSSVNPDACGRIDVTDAGRKLYAFLGATAALDLQVSALERDAKRACLAMAAELQLPDAQTAGDLKFVCGNVAREIRDGLNQSFEGEYKLQVDYQPAVCTVNADVAADVAAKCEAKASADISVTCEGTCSGTCNGACDGTCSAMGASGECAGECSGACRGSCHGSCQGSADVEAEATCQASAEIRANIDATCTDPVLTTKWEEPKVKDPARLARIDKAIKVGMGALLKIGAKLKGPVAHAAATWAKATYDLFKSGKQLLDAVGDQAICVTAEVAAAFEAVARIQASISVTVEVSVDVSGSAGGN